MCVVSPAERGEERSSSSAQQLVVKTISVAESFILLNGDFEMPCIRCNSLALSLQLHSDRCRWCNADCKMLWRSENSVLFFFMKITKSFVSVRPKQLLTRGVTNPPYLNKKMFINVKVMLKTNGADVIKHQFDNNNSAPSGKRLFVN